MRKYSLSKNDGPDILSGVTPPLSRPSRVALLVPNLWAGGAERVTLNLAEGLLELSCDVDIVVFTTGGGLDIAVPTGARVVNLDCGRAIRATIPLTRYLRRERPEVLVGTMGHTNLVGLLSNRLAGSRTRVIVTEHSAITLRPQNLVDRVYRVLARLAYPRSAAVVAVSKGVADGIVKGVGIAPEAVSTIYNPVLTERYRTQIKGGVEHEWFVDHGPPVVLGVGRLVPEKGFPTLIDAFAKLLTKREARLLILGDGPERPRLEGLVRELGIEDRVALPGFAEDAAAYMAKADVFVLSSVHEGLPTVLIEALGTGIPVVSTDCVSGPREILRGGELGRLVPVGSSAALAEAIGQALDEPRRPVDPEVLVQYTPRSAAQRYLEAAGFHG